MDIKRKITEAQGLTPTEQQLGIAEPDSAATTSNPQEQAVGK